MVRQKGFHQCLSFLGDARDTYPSVVQIRSPLYQRFALEAIHKSGNIGSANQEQIANLVQRATLIPAPTQNHEQVKAR
jgi:hypothetical protein